MAMIFLEPIENGFTVETGSRKWYFQHLDDALAHIKSIAGTEPESNGSSVRSVWPMGQLSELQETHA